MKRREEEGGGTIKNDEGDVAPNENLYNYTGCGGDNCLKIFSEVLSYKNNKERMKGREEEGGTIKNVREMLYQRKTFITAQDVEAAIVLQISQKYFLIIIKKE